MEDINARIRRIIAKCVEDVNEEELTDDMELISEGIVGSFELIQIIALLEQEFGTEIPIYEIEFEEFETVNSIAAVVERYNS